MSTRGRNEITGWGLGVLVALVTVAVTIRTGLDLGNLDIAMQPAGAMSLPLGEPAPGFILEDLDGNKVSLADQRGRVVLVDFWATWCGPCLQELPHIQQIHEQYREQGLVVLTISTDDQRNKVRPFVEKQGYTFRVLYADSQVQTAYGVQGIPLVCLIDRQGLVRFHHVGYGPGSEKQLAEEVVKLLKEKAEGPAGDQG